MMYRECNHGSHGEIFLYLLFLLDLPCHISIVCVCTTYTKVEHMKAWFMERTVCPTGCICMCPTYGSMGDQIVTVSLERGERRLFVEKVGIPNSLPSQSPSGISTTRNGLSEDFSFEYQVPYCPPFPVYGENSRNSYC